MRIVIIADDLTGANDTGVQLARKGISTAVQLNFSEKSLPSYDAVVFDTDSRSASAEAAYQKVKEICAAIQPHELETVYKKIDSTMRGNIGAEIDAMYDVFLPDFVVIAPSYPQNGRVVKNGILYVNGIPLHETETARDPKTPVLLSFLPHLLNDQTARPIACVSIKVLRNDKQYVLGQLGKWKEEGMKYVLFDAETIEDLQQIISLFESIDYRIIWCGSAGLANVLPLKSGEGSVSQKLFTGSLPFRQVLAVIGSVSAKTRKQLEILLREPDVYGIEVIADQVLTEESFKVEFQRVWLLAIQALSKQQNVVVYSSGFPEDIENAQLVGRKLGIDKPGVSNLIGGALGKIAARIIRECDIQHTILTGGDTAKQVCECLGANELELIDEVESGAPLSRLAGANDIYAITKAGGFGDDFSLLRFLNFYRGGK